MYQLLNVDVCQHISRQTSYQAEARGMRQLKSLEM